MSNLPISSKYVSTPAVAVDTAEREAVLVQLNAAFSKGLLDDLDYQQLLDLTFAARTLGELRPVVERLPAQATHEIPAVIVAGTTPPGELTQARAAHLTTVLLGAGAVVAALLLIVVVLGLIL